MHETMFQGRVENGQIKLPAGVQLPEDAVVYVVIPGTARPLAYVGSPRLVHPEQAADFQIEVIEDPSDARI